MFRLAKKIEQRRNEIDMTHRLRNDFAAFLTRQPDQVRNARGFFEHYLFPEQMMRAQAVTVIARVHDDRIVSQADSFQAIKNGTDALIDQRDQPEISPFNASIFLERDSEEQLNGQSFSIQYCFRL